MIGLNLSRGRESLSKMIAVCVLTVSIPTGALMLTLYYQYCDVVLVLITMFCEALLVGMVVERWNETGEILDFFDII